VAVRFGKHAGRHGLGVQDDALTCIQEGINSPGCQGTLDSQGPLEAGNHVAGHACDPRELGLLASPFLLLKLPNHAIQVFKVSLPQAFQRLADLRDSPLRLAHVVRLPARYNRVDCHLRSYPMGKKKEAQPNRL
jgi:hypothetical protein